MKIRSILENISPQQRGVGQLPADFRPAQTSPQLSGPYPGRNATRGYLVGEDQDVAEATGDKPFDQMMRMIKKGTKKQATADRRARDAASRERARAAFGPSPADKLSIRPDKSVAEGHADQQRKIFKRNGQPVGEVGIDRESSPGVGQYYMKHYASGTDNSGYDSREEALADLRHVMKQSVYGELQGQGVSEAGVTWHGTQSGREEAAMTDHTVYDAKQYLKANYPVVKTYNVRRAEPGFRILKRPDELRKSEAHIVGVDGAVDYLQLEKNAMMSGSSQWSASIGSSWSVYENTSNGIAIIYYQDRGMGSDSITVAGKTPKIQAQARQVFIDAGVLPEPRPRAGRSVDKPGVEESGWNPLDDERREQRAMDQERRQFKRDEIEAELAGEEERYRQIMQGTWYVIINGRAWQRQSQPVTFQGREAARRAAQTIKNRSPERTVSITSRLPVAETSCLDENAVAAFREAVAEGITSEDVLNTMKRRLGDYLQDVATAIRKDPDLIDKIPQAVDQIGPAVRTIKTDDGHEIRIHGNEDDGFRVSIRNRTIPSRFHSLDEAEMATEMYCSRRRQAAQLNDDYRDEA